MVQIRIAERSETQNGNLKGSGSADVSMEVPPKMSCSRSCSLPCEMDDTPVGFARCRSRCDDHMLFTVLREFVVCIRE